MKTVRDFPTWVIGLVATLVLSSCGRRDETASLIPATPPPSATVALAAATAALPVAMAMSNPASGLSFSSVTLGSSADANHRIRAGSSNFSPTDVIHAAVETIGSGEAMLSAAWTDQDGQVVLEDSKSIKVTGAQTTAFTLLKPGGLAAGDYKLEISLNGNLVDSKNFSVK